MIEFFKNSCLLDYEVLRPLAHIKPNWELTNADKGLYFEKEILLTIDRYLYELSKKKVLFVEKTLV